jgi:hypothetical protein
MAAETKCLSDATSSAQRALRRPPLSASRHQFRPDPLRSLARNPGARLHLDENGFRLLCVEAVKSGPQKGFAMFSRIRDGLTLTVEVEGTRAGPFFRGASVQQKLTTTEQIARLLDEIQGASRRSRARPSARAMAEDLDAEIVAARVAGVPEREICHKLGCTFARVHAVRTSIG